MFGLDTKRCSIAGTDLQPAPPKTARNKTNPKNSLPKRISKLQRIVHLLSTLEHLQNVKNVEMAAERFGDFARVWRGFAGLKNSMADKKIRLFPFLAGVFLFFQSLAGRERWTEKLIPIPAARAEVPKFLDAACCRCSNACAPAASAQSSLPASRIPHVRPRKPY